MPDPDSAPKCKNTPKAEVTPTEEPMKKCRACAKLIPAEASICFHCKTPVKPPLNTWEWITRTTAAIAFALSVFTFWQGQRSQKVAADQRESSLVDEAVKLLEENEPKAFHRSSSSANQRREEAKRKLDEASSLRPDDPKVHWALARYFLYRTHAENTGKYLENSLIELQKAIKADPANSGYFAELGFVFYDDFKYEDARKSVSRALELNSANAYAYNVLGMIDFHDHHLDNAETSYRKAIQSDFGDPRGYDNLGALLIQKGQYEEALQMLREAWAREDKKNPIGQNRFETLNNMGVCLDKLDRPDEAIELYRKALELDPENAKAYQNLGFDLLRTNKGDEAVRMCKKAIEFDPSEAKAHFCLANALRKTGNIDESQEELSRTAKIDPGYLRYAELIVTVPKSETTQRGKQNHVSPNKP